MAAPTVVCGGVPRNASWAGAPVIAKLLDTAAVNDPSAAFSV